MGSCFFSAPEMEDKKELIVSGLKGVCNEQNNKVGNKKKLFLWFCLIDFMF